MMYIRIPTARTKKLYEPSDNGLSIDQYTALPAAQKADYRLDSRDFKSFLKWMILRQTREVVGAMPNPINPGQTVLPQGVAEAGPNFYADLNIQYSTIQHRLEKGRFPSEDAREAAEEAYFQLTHQVTDYQDAYWRCLGKIDAGVLTSAIDADLMAEYVATIPRVNPNTIQGQRMVFSMTNIGQRTSFIQYGASGGISYQVAHGAFYDGILLGAMLTFEGKRTAGSIELQIRHGLDVDSLVTLPTMVYSGPDNLGGTGNASHSSDSACTWEFGQAGVMPRTRYPRLNLFKIYGRDLGFTPTGSEGMLTVFYKDTPPPHITI